MHLRNKNTVMLVIKNALQFLFFIYICISISYKKSWTLLTCIELFLTCFKKQWRVWTSLNMTWRICIYLDRKEHNFLKTNDVTTEPAIINIVWPHSPREKKKWERGYHHEVLATDSIEDERKRLRCGLWFLFRYTSLEEYISPNKSFLLHQPTVNLW